MDAPVYDVDMFSDDVLDAPYEHYRALREMGPAVWLTQHDAYAVTRFADVRAVLGDAATFCSGQGVGLNDFINTVGPGTTLMSDGEDHARMRRVISQPLTPRAVADLRPQAQAIAEQMVDGLVARGSFDAVTDLAQVLPTQWVPDLLGWPADARDKLLRWGAAAFDGLGPMNERCAAAGEGVLEMSSHAALLAQSELPVGSMAAGILAAAARGEMEADRCPMAIVDYLAPSLDTTISGIGNAMWLFATHPEQWRLLREDPSRVRHAFNEALRVESPISCFSRVATRDTKIDGEPIPAGARVVVFFASANRDERRWPNADVFDITRDNADQLAFGHGEHACVGMGLARLEGAAVLSALAARVERIELVGEPVRKHNNLIRSFESLPMRAHLR